MAVKTSHPRTRGSDSSAGQVPRGRRFVSPDAGMAVSRHEFSKISLLPPSGPPVAEVPVQLMHHGGLLEEGDSDPEDADLLGTGINPLEIEAPPAPQPTIGQRVGGALRSAAAGTGRFFESIGRRIGGALGLSYSERPQQIHDDFERFSTQEWQAGATRDKLRDLYKMQERVNRHIKESEKQGAALTPEMDGRIEQLRGHFEAQIGELRAAGGDLELPETWSSRLSRVPLLGRAFSDPTQEARDLWQGLQAGGSTIRVDAGELVGGAQGEFVNRTHTQLARMMSSKTARKMLRKMQADHHTVTIRPSLVMDNAGARAENEGAATIERSIGPRPGEARSRRPRPRRGHAEDRHHYSNSGGGSNVNVNMPALMADTQLRGFSKREREYPLPSYSVLAHELIHGRHMQEGTLRNEVPMERITESRRGTPESVEGWDNYEEYHTIQGGKTSSNKIDDELGLPTRWDHRGTFEAEHEDVAANAGAFGYEEI